MSKQSEAKASQNYIPKAHNCGDCANLKMDLVLPAWMREQNAKEPGRWGDDRACEKNIRCGIGGFVVKKMGSCGQHIAKDAA